MSFYPLVIHIGSVDEVAGMWIAGFAYMGDPTRLILAFLFFRLFDIWKPGPINSLQRLPNGWGVMVDDILAGILAWPLAYYGSQFL